MLMPEQLGSLVGRGREYLFANINIIIAGRPSIVIDGSSSKVAIFISYIIG